MGETPTGLAALASTLQSTLTTDAFMSSLNTIVPVIGGVVVFAFVYRVVRRIISGAPKGKARI